MVGTTGLSMSIMGAIMKAMGMFMSGVGLIVLLRLDGSISVILLG